MKIIPNTYDGYKLFHDGVLALADVEANGMRIDIDYCERQMSHLDRRIEKLDKKLRKESEVKSFEKKNKSLNFNSDQQLQNFFYDHLEIETPEDGKRKVDQQALESFNLPIVEDILLYKRLGKAKSTYLANILNETVDGYLRPFFHLNLARSMRSSSSNPNFQNIPVRIKEIKKIVRKAFIPRPGNMLGEIDYSGAEVRCAACNHKDPEMIKEIKDPSRDMHRDMAMMCYKVPKKEMTSEIRFCGKNMFVFPQFYGDYYVRNATDLWDAISLLNLETKSGVPLKRHLKSKGIPNYRRFEKHLKTVEDYFWKEKFKVYDQWREDLWDYYCKHGHVNLKTGFQVKDLMTKNKVTNAPIQGPAFHWLLWSLIKLNRWLKESGKKTLIIGQIHDSIVLDICPPEKNEVIEKARYIMTKQIKLHWDWIIVPLKIDVELTPIDKSWYYKEEYKMEE